RLSRRLKASRLRSFRDEDVCVAVEREALARVPDLRRDLGHGHALAHLHADVAMPEIVWAKAGEPGHAAGVADRVADRVLVRAGKDEAGLGAIVGRAGRLDSSH